MVGVAGALLILSRGFEAGLNLLDQRKSFGQRSFMIRPTFNGSRIVKTERVR